MNFTRLEDIASPTLGFDQDCSSWEDYGMPDQSPASWSSFISMAKNTSTKEHEGWLRYLLCITRNSVTEEKDKGGSQLYLSKLTVILIMIITSIFFLGSLCWVHWYTNLMDQSGSVFREQYRWFYRPLPSDFSVANQRAPR